MFPAWRRQLRAARVAMDDGRFSDAAGLLADDSLREFLPAKRLAHRLAGQVAQRQQALEGRLHAALAASDWIEALSAADALLELVPGHSAARRARRKAWKAVGLEATEAFRPEANGSPLRDTPIARGIPSGEPIGRITVHQPAAQAARLRRLGTRYVVKSPPSKGVVRGGTTNADGQPIINDPVRASANSPSPGPSLRGRGGYLVNPTRQTDRRLVAWIDAVGAYLLCLGDEIVLGQPSAEGGVDVPILADLSRRHAVIRRDAGAYVLTPLHAASIDGRPIAEPTVLRDDSFITLGDAVQLRFRQPHALSSTAVLEILSHHRSKPAVTSIVLMGESCIFGPQGHSHVRCRHWPSELVLFRRGQELMGRSEMPLTIDGRPAAGQATLGHDCRIEGDDLAMTLEEI